MVRDSSISQYASVNVSRVFRLRASATMLKRCSRNGTDVTSRWAAACWRLAALKQKPSAEPSGMETTQLLRHTRFCPLLAASLLQLPMMARCTSCPFHFPQRLGYLRSTLHSRPQVHVTPSCGHCRQNQLLLMTELPPQPELKMSARPPVLTMLLQQLRSFRERTLRSLTLQQRQECRGLLPCSLSPQMDSRAPPPQCRSGCRWGGAPPSPPPQWSASNPSKNSRQFTPCPCHSLLLLCRSCRRRTSCRITRCSAREHKPISSCPCIHLIDSIACCSSCLISCSTSIPTT